MSKQVTSAKVPGVIEPQSMYALDELKARTRVGTWGLRKMREAGLIVYRARGRAFVLGSDFIHFVREHGQPQRTVDSESAETHESTRD